MKAKKSVFTSPKKTYTKHFEKHLSAIFNSMANPHRLEILKVLYSKGSTSYTDLKATAGFGTQKESGKFAYHLRKLTKLSLIEKNNSERRYNITSKGKMTLEYADKIEANAFMESGKLQVRSSNSSIDEFNKQRILQSLVKEGDMPYELADKITKEVENKIHKYEISYITGALIRDMVNSVLLETTHEEYRSKLVRLGMPLYEVNQMLKNLNGVDGGMDDILFAAGKNVLTENTMFNTLPKDLADKHMKGSIHISNLVTWFTLPDVLFVNIKDILDGGVDIGGKYTTASRLPKLTQIDDIVASLSIMIQLLLKEASSEVVLAGLPQLLAKKCSDTTSDDEIESGLLLAFMTSSVAIVPVASGASTDNTSCKFDGKVASIRLNLGSDARMANCILNAYAKYVKLTPRPRIGLVINYEKEKIESISARIAQIVLLGGRILFTKLPQVSSSGIVGGSLNKADSTLSMALQSVSVNLPSLAHEVDKGDAEYFMARLMLMLNPVIDALIQRKKEVFDATRRGLNPLTAKNTQYMQRGYASLTVNLVGLREAVFEILGFEYNRKGRNVVQKIIGQAVSLCSLASKNRNESVTISIVDSDGAERIARIDSRQYGKSDVGPGDTRPYSQGLIFAASEISNYTNKSPSITLCNKISRNLSAGLQVTLRISEDENDVSNVADAIKKMSTLVPSFTPVKDITLCAECSFKGRPFDTKCPSCHAPKRTG